MSGPVASQITEKLALIPRLTYITCDLGGVEWPPHDKLIATDFSHSAGEKRANSLFSKLTTPFGRAVGATMMAGAMIATPMGAMANDGNNSLVHNTSTTMQVPQIQSMTFDEIKQDAAFTQGRVILHYGSGIVDADLVAEGLSLTGTPAIAVSGGPDCGIRLIISGVSNENFCFTQSHLNRGEVGGLAERMLPRIIQKQATPQKQASLNLEN